jgi:valyl-tRNA synthetase
METLPSAYNPKPVEEKIYSKWEKSGYFNPDNLPISKTNPPAGRPKTKTYVIYMPLPNVTGSLHMGHALDNTGPDILIRYLRMKGYRTLWLPGTDHAGIATQYVVEKELKKEGKNRWELGREKFIERVWEWKNKYGSLILDQLKKLGCSADWSRTRFTMDPDYSRDVLNAFIHYYKKGLIYQGFRTVNWCPRCETSLSELELEYSDEKTILYYIKYGPFTLATTRPETKFGDTALAVNPKDKRYRQYVGQMLEVDSLSTEGDLNKPEIQKIKLQVVADETVDAEFGTGIVKVTPAHDLTDFEIAQRHGLPMIQIIDERGRMTEKVGKYAGLKTAEARKKVVEDMKAVGLLVKEESYNHRIAKCYRCGVVIEPIPSKQWFLKMDSLAKMALKAVKEKKVSIKPKNFEKPYFAWLENIRDWTISRQIWWGHRLPVWQCKCQTDGSSKFDPPAGEQNSKLTQREQGENFIISLTDPKKKCSVCNSEYKQVPDVLDTWFSSALWPFAGLSKETLEKYYPGNLVSNARDILNLWDARMIFSGLEFMGEVPFKNVLIHGTILTKEGKRMSKSLGTGIDPLKYIEEYGADATRFGIIWQATGQDIRWDETAIIAGKKFINKLWNISRYIFGKVGDNFEIKVSQVRKEENKKILEILKKTKKIVEKNLIDFQFSKALRELYNFVWHEFADKYLEYSKKDESDETKNVLAFCLYEILKMLHPFIPFVTEEIYEKLSFPGKKEVLMIENF